jgi:hypothetical protein
MSRRRIGGRLLGDSADLTDSSEGLTGATPYEQSVVFTASLLQARSRWLDDEGVTDQRPALSWATGDPANTDVRGRVKYRF